MGTYPGQVELEILVIGNEGLRSMPFRVGIQNDRIIEAALATARADVDMEAAKAKQEVIRMRQIVNDRDAEVFRLRDEVDQLVAKLPRRRRFGRWLKGA